LSSPRPILKTLVAFANTAGGYLVIGITDAKQLVSIESGVYVCLGSSNRQADQIRQANAPLGRKHCL